MNILYVGINSGTSHDRFQALKRLGHNVNIINPFDALPMRSLASKWSFHTGALGLYPCVNKYVLNRAPDIIDLVIIDSGELIGPRLIKSLKKRSPYVININLDNPYVNRDGNRWRLFHQSLPLYDAIFTPRDTSVSDALNHGAQRAYRIWQAANDPLISLSNHPNEAEKSRFRSPVSFTGTWMPERGAFMATLIKRGVPLRIIGPRWDRASELHMHKDHIIAGWLDARSYQAAVSAAEISIALTSKGNMDTYTTRSLEIPTLGSLLLAERTLDHLSLYREGVEAFFWNTAEECAEICLNLLRDPDRLASARSAGRLRALANGHFNEPLMSSIISKSIALPRNMMAKP